MRKYWVFSFCGWLEVCQAGHTSRLELLSGWETARFNGTIIAKCKADALHLARSLQTSREACWLFSTYVLNEAACWASQKAAEEPDLVIED